MARTSPNIGDLFEVECDRKKGYFQYVGNDETQLNAPVIRAFCGRYDLDDQPTCDDIASDLVDFFTHTFIGTGIKVGAWTKMGNSKILGNFKDVFFRQSRDYGHHKVAISYDWEVWRINGPRRHVGPLPTAYHSAEPGEVIPPHLVVERMTMGEWTYSYPAFE